MRPLRWTTRSTSHLSDALGKLDHPCASRTAAKDLKALGFTLRGNDKILEGTQHPDRNAQFGYINDLAAARLPAGQPVISVDTKKKELVGNYARTTSTATGTTP